MTSPLLSRMLLLALWLCPAVAQTQVTPGPDGVTNAPVLPPLPKSPITIFREVLAMKPEQREAFLAARPAENRVQLEKKIEQYLAMQPAARNSALAATELRWYLEYFMNVPPAVRAQQLSSVPEPYRKIVADRVNVFTILPPDLQKDVLAHKTTAGYFFGPAPELAAPAPPMPPRPLVEIGRLSLEQRQKMYETFQDFFELPAAERESVLLSLPEAKRREVELSLQTLERLPREQREQGLAAIGRLVVMTVDQRREFFSNVARWKELSPAEREAWLKLVNRLPPMPPGAQAPIMPPPLPGLSTQPIGTNAP